MTTRKTARPARPASKNNLSPTSIRKKESKNPLYVEIISIALVVMGFILLISFFSEDAGGFFGKTVNKLFVSFFGVTSFFIPILTVYARVSMKNESFNSSFVILIISFMICISSLAGIITKNHNIKYLNFAEYIITITKNANLFNGGVLGTLFGDLFYYAFGKIGSFIVVIASMIIILILVSKKSFFGFIRKISLTVVHELRERIQLDDHYEEEILEYIEKKPQNKVKKTIESEFFTINKGKKTLDKDDIILVNEELKHGGKPITIIKEYKSDNIILPLKNKFEDPIIANDDNIKINVPDYEFLQEEAFKRETSKIKLVIPVKNKSIEESQISLNFSDSSEDYIFPSLELLNKNHISSPTDSKAYILENSHKLEKTLKSFGVEAKVIEVSKGPAVTRYELSPGQGVKVSKISNLADDLALNLAAVGIRIEAPIPGKPAVGIEIPNKEVTPVFLREVISDKNFINFPSKLAFGLGKDIAGNPVIADISKMPHLLIAGATGSGKSVCINTLVTSILYKANPDEVKLLMIDPKVVELSIYNGIPHLLIPVVTDPKKASGALNWAVQEMTTRYNLFAETGARDLASYNRYLLEHENGNFLPQIVIIIDELADLMMVAAKEVEDSICRLAQMARAAGIHLIIATQRPSVDVITGVIKANIPSRLAFSVSSGIDSRTILDMIGAEKLLGKGDMLFYPVGINKPIRIQGSFISDKEVESIVSFIKDVAGIGYDQEMVDKITTTKVVSEENTLDEDNDEFLNDVVEFLIEKGKASASVLQRQFRIGYNRASRLIEDLESKGIISSEDDGKARKVLINFFEWEEYKKSNINKH